MKMGVELISEERARQVSKEGFLAEHDDAHNGNELALAAVCYATPWPVFSLDVDNGSYHFVDPWPSDLEDMDKRRKEGYLEVPVSAFNLTVAERIIDLVKAGALIAAEIDRLTRLQEKGIGMCGQKEPACG